MHEATKVDIEWWRKKRKGNSGEKSGEEFSPLTWMAGKSTVCITGEITAQNGHVRPGVLCTAWTVASELEEGFAHAQFICLDGQDMAMSHTAGSGSTTHTA